jgi:hypothetical protein
VKTLDVYLIICFGFSCLWISFLFVSLRIAKDFYFSISLFSIVCLKHPEMLFKYSTIRARKGFKKICLFDYNKII